MGVDKSDMYDLEPDDEQSPVSGEEIGGDEDDSRDVDPVDLEPDEPDESIVRGKPTRSVKDLDVCPNCGATMRGGDTLVCIRCGFDLKTMKPVKTKVAQPSHDDEDDDNDDEDKEEVEPLCQPTPGDPWVPVGMAAASGFVLILAYLGGARGLFAVDATESISFNDRITGLLQFVVLVGLWSACGLAALFFIANLMGMKLGDIKLAGLRMLGIIATIRLASLINFSSQSLEWLAEAALYSGLFIVLSMVTFRMSPRDAATLGASAVVLCLVLWLGAYVVVWVGAAG